MSWIVDEDQVLTALSLEAIPDDLALYIEAVTAHVTEHYGQMPSGTYTERVYVSNGRLLTSHYPVLSITSVADTWDAGITYEDGFTILPGAWSFRHPSLYDGSTWDITYVAGYDSVPYDLQLAALEDIRGLYQPARIGPPAAFGAFGIDSTEVGPNHRPVRMWPRVDAWIESRRTPGIA